MADIRYPNEPPQALLVQIAEAIASLRYGTVQITVHNARVVQIDKVERTRVPVPADLTPGRLDASPPPDRISEGHEPARGR